MSATHLESFSTDSVGCHCHVLSSNDADLYSTSGICSDESLYMKTKIISSTQFGIYQQYLLAITKRNKRVCVSLTLWKDFKAVSVLQPSTESAIFSF